MSCYASHLYESDTDEASGSELWTCDFCGRLFQQFAAAVAHEQEAHDPRRWAAAAVIQAAWVAYGRRCDWRRRTRAATVIQSAFRDRSFEFV